MRLIDADALVRRLNKISAEPDYQHENEDWQVGLILAEDAIYDAPTIDAVEVVRCRECKRVQTTNCPLFKAKWRYTDNDYCSCGVRRGDGEV